MRRSSSSGTTGRASRRSRGCSRDCSLGERGRRTRRPADRRAGRPGRAFKASGTPGCSCSDRRSWTTSSGRRRRRRRAAQVAPTSVRPRPGYATSGAGASTKVERRSDAPGRAGGGVLAGGSRARSSSTSLFAGLDAAGSRSSSRPPAHRHAPPDRHRARDRLARPRSPRRPRRPGGRARSRPHHARRAARGRPPRGAVQSASAAPARERPKGGAARRETELTFLRLVLRKLSPVHRLWAGTKLLIAAELAVLVWVLADLAGHRHRGRCRRPRAAARPIPLGAFPLLPAWFFLASSPSPRSSACGQPRNPPSTSAASA